MLRFSLLLLLLSTFTVNTQASSILPQEASTGTDGNLLALNSSSTLFNNTSNVYNFIDFNITSGATLNINNNGAVYIYSQQSITINGALITNSPDLHLIAQTINFNGNITSNGGDLLIASASSNPVAPDLSNGAIISSNPNTIVTTGVIETGTVSWDGNIVVTANPGLTPVGDGTTGPIVISPSPVPVPAALWLMMSGLFSLTLLRRRKG